MARLWPSRVALDQIAYRPVTDWLGICGPNAELVVWRLKVAYTGRHDKGTKDTSLVNLW